MVKTSLQIIKQADETKYHIDIGKGWIMGCNKIKAWQRINNDHSYQSFPHLEWMSDCCLTPNEHFQLYHCENNLQSMRWCPLCTRLTRFMVFLLCYHTDNSPGVDMSGYLEVPRLIINVPGTWHFQATHLPPELNVNCFWFVHHNYGVHTLWQFSIYSRQSPISRPQG